MTYNYLMLVRLIILKSSVNDIATKLNVPPSSIEDLEGLMSNTSQETLLQYHTFIYETLGINPKDYIRRIVENIIREFYKFSAHISIGEWSDIAVGRTVIAYNLVDNNFRIAPYRNEYGDPFNDFLVDCYSGVDLAVESTFQELSTMLSNYYDGDNFVINKYDNFDVDCLEAMIKNNSFCITVLAAYEFKKARENVDYWIIEEQLIKWSELRELKLQEYSVLE